MLRKLFLRDYDELLALWRSCEGVGLSEGDDRNGLRLFLQRNPGLSFVPGVRIGSWALELRLAKFSLV